MKPASALAALLCLALSPAVLSAKPKTPPAPPKVDQAAVALLKPYDKDSNYEISRAELTAIQTDYAANPTGPLKIFDRDGNGKIDDGVDLAYMNIKLGELKMNEKPDKPKTKKPKP